MDSDGQRWTVMDSDGQSWTVMDSHVPGKGFRPRVLFSISEEEFEEMVPLSIRRVKMVDRLYECVFNTNQSESVYISQI